MEYPVHKADARALVRVLIGQFDVDLPKTAGEGCLFRTLESYVEFLPATY